MDLPADLRLRLEQARRQMNDSGRLLSRLTQDAADIRQRIAAEQSRWSQANERAYTFLAARLERQRVIEQAIGALMAQRHCSPEQAQQALRAQARADGLTLEAAAAALVQRAQEPAARSVGNGHSPAAARRQPVRSGRTPQLP